MTLQGELIATRQAIAGKRAELSYMFAEADNLKSTAARDAIATKVTTTNQELEALIDKYEVLNTEYEVGQASRNALKSMRQPVDRQVDPGDDAGGWSGSANYTTPRAAGPNWGQAVLKAAEEQSGIRGLKAMLPSGAAIVSVPVGGPIADPRRANFLADLMPVKDAPGGHFKYLRQTTRTNNAAVVADAALKPTSIFTLEEVEDSTDVIAHLSEAVPGHYFEDSDNVVQFVEAEMRLGVNLALDAKIVTDIFAAPILAEGDIGTTLDTTRRCITRLEERDVDPSCWVFHPRDWEQIELEMTAAWTANANVPAPTDEVRRSLYGIPVVVSNALTQNTGLLGDFRTSAALYRTGGVSVTWNAASTELFDYNLIKMRAEGRFAVAIYRPFAFVSINLAGTGS